MITPLEMLQKNLRMFGLFVNRIAQIIRKHPDFYFPL